MSATRLSPPMDARAEERRHPKPYVPDEAPTRNLRLPLIASIALAVGTAVVSLMGISLGSELYGTDPPLTLVSPGGDLANLAIVLPTLIAATCFAWRGSFVGLLLWPGALFYALYIYAVYLVGAPAGMMLFAYVALVVVSATSLVVTLASTDTEEIRARLTNAPVRVVGGALLIIGVAAYAGLTATALSEFTGATGEPGLRPQWVIDCALGTPPLLVAGLLALLRRPMGYATVGGLLFVSGLGGLAFAAAAVFQGLLSGSSIEAAVVTVHLVIGAVSFGLLVWFLSRGAKVTEPVMVGDAKHAISRGTSPRVIRT